jgi:hypothetical protein
VIDHVDDLEMRVVVAEVLAAAANAVIVAIPLKTWCPSDNRTGLSAGAKSRAMKQLGEWRNARNSVW